MSHSTHVNTASSITLPGPRGRFPGHLGLAFRADPLRFLERAAGRFGDASAFRVGRTRYAFFTDPEVIREVLVAKADRFIKSPALRQAKITLGEGLLTSEGDFHRRQRKLAQPAFHPARVATYAGTMVRRARQTSDEWRARVAGGRDVVDLHAEMMRVTLRVVTETLFSASVDAEIDAIGDSMDVMVGMFRRARNPFAPVLNKLPLPSNYRFLRALRHVKGTIDRFVADNRAAGVDRGDLLSTLVRARDTGGEHAELVSSSAAAPRPDDPSAGMDDVQLGHEIMTLFTAGHETTANALTFTWRLLARHPEVADRLYAEADAALGGRDPTAADLDALPFARAVVAESMRLYPPAWVLMREASADVEVGGGGGPGKGVLLPAGSVSVVSQWVTHRDPRWWPDPARFDPDRWLDAAAKEARPRYAYFPFGGGPRNCIGESFAWTEAILILVALAQHWRMTDVTTRPMRLLPTITLRPRDPVWVKLRSRG